MQLLFLEYKKVLKTVPFCLIDCLLFVFPKTFLNKKPKKLCQPHLETILKSTLLIAAVAVIVVLLGINGYMIYNRSQLKTQATELSADLDETTKLKEELNKQYYSALSELEGMRGTNEELNSLIDQQKQELDASKGRIETLLKDKGNLSKARTEVANLQGRINQLLAEVKQMAAAKTKP